MIDQIIKSSEVSDILQRVLNGERLSVEDGVRLFESDDLPAIGAAANEIRKRINGNKTYYVVNRHINYTDICKNRCAFCAYSRNEGEEGAYLMSLDEIIDRATRYWNEMQFTELHIVGGLHPTMPLDYYVNMLSELKKRFPDVHIQAFTAVEIAHISEVSGLSISDTLDVLQKAGLGSMPGGGAEVFSKRVRDAVCPEKMPGDAWLSVMRQAHKQGIKSNSTMLYGHIETCQERVEHMVTLRDLQDETGGFMTFIPLKFHPANTKLAHIAAQPNSTDDLKLYAISRLMLDNIPHIKVFWIMLGIKLAQVALSFGADDFDGTVVEEKITHRAGATTPEGLTVSQLLDLIEETGTVAVERDTVYNEVIRNEAGILPYLNVKPLIYTLEHGGLPMGWECVYAPPSKLAQMLVTGEIAAAPVSSFATFLYPELKICPDICISADGPVISVLLLSKKPFNEVKTVALDTSSLSGANMLKIILDEAYNLHPELVRISPDPVSGMLDQCDAAMVIGNPAMLYPKDGLFVMDLAQEWGKMTGLPAVFAVWAGREMTPELIKVLQDAKAQSTKMIPEIVREESAKLGLSEELCEDYLTRIISFDMGDREIQGLNAFKRKAIEHGLVPNNTGAGSI